MSFVAAVADFARLLHALEVPMPPDRIVTALRALEAIGLHARRDVKAALRATLVSCREHVALFDVAFDWYWRDAIDGLGTRPTSAPSAPGTPTVADLLQARVAEAWKRSQGMADPPATPPADRPERDSSGTASGIERLRTLDFQHLSPADLAQIQRQIAALRVALRPLPVRRLQRDPRGRHIDLRATLQDVARTGGESLLLCRRAPQRRPPPLVVLCDISGSMRHYSLLYLHLVHTLSRELDRVSAFVFGTRLTNVSRRLEHRDVEVALQGVSDVVEDFSGGTRIGGCLREFNRHWSRRVLGQRATVLLITDGLERDEPELLADEAARLRRSCRRLLWLNPLLRYDGFEPTARGMRALLPAADRLMPAHDFASLANLVQALAAE